MLDGLQATLTLLSRQDQLLAKRSEEGKENAHDEFSPYVLLNKSGLELMFSPIGKFFSSHLSNEAATRRAGKEIPAIVVEADGSYPIRNNASNSLSKLEVRFVFSQINSLNFV